ncbi:sugar phosphate isomerase/epimerase [Rhodococcus opacus]|nr:sugar phosphate isomerase/epimerase [Rhodococcus opacus]
MVCRPTESSSFQLDTEMKKDKLVSFTQRFTSHLGYAPPALRPQFAETVATGDPIAHINYAASIGMSGVFDPWVLRRNASEIAEMAETLIDTGLLCSALVAVPLELVATPVWVDRSRSGRRLLEQHVRAAAQTASTLGSTQLAVLVAGDGIRTYEQQLPDAAASLGEMSRLSGDFGVELTIEPMIVLPNMLLRNMAAAVEAVQLADSAGIGIIFDTGHVSVTDGDLLRAYDTAREHISAVQVVDMPGRVEPGAGNLPIVDLIATAISHGYTGLIDLEHYWLDSSLTGEQTGLERLRAFDALVDAAVATRTNTPVVEQTQETT